MSYKIKKNGWLWNLHKETASNVYWKLQYGEPVGLCAFFWSTVFQLLRWAAAAIGFSIFVVGTLAILFGIIYWIVGLVSAAFGVFIPIISYDFIYAATFFILLAGTLVIIIDSILHIAGSASAMTTKVWPDYITHLIPEKARKEVVIKEDSLLKAYLKAFKGKVCPLVEVAE